MEIEGEKLGQQSLAIRWDLAILLRSYDWGNEAGEHASP